MKRVLYTMMIATFLNPFTASSLTMAFPDMIHEFGATVSDVGWIVEAFLLCCTMAIIPGGKLADIYGKRKIFSIGLGAFTALSFLSCFVDSILLLTIYRGLQGLALGLVFTTSMSILTLSVPKEKRGYAFGMIGGMVYVAVSVGPVLGGLLNYYCGWRSIFIFTTLLGLVANYMCATNLKEEWIESPHSHLSPSKTFLFMGGIGLLMFGLTEWSNLWYSMYLVLAGIAGLFLLGRMEWHSEDPLVPVRMFFENPIFTISSMAAMLNFGATFGIGFLLSLYLQLFMGFDSRMTGIILCIQTVIMILLGPRMGALSDRKNPAILSALGMGISGIGLFLMAYATGSDTIYLIMGALACVGVGFSLFAAPNNNRIMNSVSKQYISFASSTISTVRLLGQTISMACIGVITSQNRGAVTVFEGLKEHITIGFFIFAAICCVGIFLALYGYKKKEAPL